MKLEHQVCSLGLAKRLKELGAQQESYFSWYQGSLGIWHLGDPVDTLNNAVDVGHTTAPQRNEAAAFTAAELGEILPMTVHGDFDQLISEKAIQHWFVYYSRSREPAVHQVKCNLHLNAADTEADARAKMLIYLLEKRLLAIS